MLTRAAIALSLIASLLAPAVRAGELSEVERPAGKPGDAVVVAVIDFTFSPYHWDFAASKMPVRYPLGRAPHGWLPGFPDPGRFASYESLDLSLDDRTSTAAPDALAAKDAQEWEKVRQSTREEVHYYWMPGTKVIGAIDFGGTKIHGPTSAHGTGTASVSTGNLHGTCPECLLVFINVATAADAEAAIGWAMEQPWIDAITNSYGFSATPVTRDRIYSGSDVKLQKQASERGQTIFFSAGNGQENAFLVPNTTLLSSQEGPDWIVTVGAVSPGAHASYTGHGKPADIASLGSGYPSAYNSSTVSGSGNFGGTSNATPVIAGIYSRALWIARNAMSGASRTQSGGVIARGAFRCGSTRAGCELGDGKLTASELRTRLFMGAVHTEAGLTPGGVGSLPRIGEEEFLAEGHGSYFGRESGKRADWMKEFERLVGPMLGRAGTLKRPAGEREWMTVDSWCRQHLWGSWTGGYYIDGRTKLPAGRDPQWPLRSALLESCPLL